MKRNIKTAIMLLATTAACGVAGAQTDNKMGKNNNQRVADTLMNSYQKIENGVVNGYKAIENGVVDGYTAIQDGVVEGYTRISDAFIKKYLMRKGETLDEAKERIAREEEALHRQSHDRTAAMHKGAREVGHATKERSTGPSTKQ